MVKRENGVLSLTIAPGKNALLLCKMARCPYCIKLYPVLTEVATQYKRDVFYLDSADDAEAMNLLGVSGYPTVFIVNRMGIILSQYTGNRDPASIEQALTLSETSFR